MLSYAQHNMYTEAEFYGNIMGKDSLVDRVLREREKYKLQLICTTIKEDEPTFYMHATKDEYFYPASLVKFPTALATLEIMNERGLELDDYIRINNDFSCGNQNYVQLSQKNKLTFRRLIKEMMVVSDNDFYNILYQLVTPYQLNRRLHNKSYTGVHIYRAFTGCDSLEQLKTNSLDVYRGNEIVYHQDASQMSEKMFFENYRYNIDLRLGSKHEAPNGEIVEGPFDFNYNLVFPLSAIHQMFVRLMYPEFDLKEFRWDIRDEDRLWLLTTMYEYPRDLENKKYHNEKKYPNNFMKYLYLGESTSHKDRTASKIGLSYGFTTETAYLPIEDNGGMFISITMYTNANDTVNDGKYEYEEIARPFLARLGELIRQHYGVPFVVDE